MQTLYCEFCGKPVKCRNAQGLLQWLRSRRQIVRCNQHARASALAPAAGTHDPETGQRIKADYVSHAHGS